MMQSPQKALCLVKFDEAFEQGIKMMSMSSEISLSLIHAQGQGTDETAW